MIKHTERTYDYIHLYTTAAVYINISIARLYSTNKNEIQPVNKHNTSKKTKQNEKLVQHQWCDLVHSVKSAFRLGLIDDSVRWRRSGTLRPVRWRRSARRATAHLLTHDLEHDQLARAVSVSKGNDRTLGSAHAYFEHINSSLKKN